ncbi:hypothetical protein TanjilG_17787 [Lupinus angustifolius]|uniref:glutathione transferase n=1 Tax=Lupinus angustifolius TaxID=3871 RepID=A0A4P1RTR1_LUPAN|nr:PREDICTED: glutathione transferase GST 23-like [Lupinus angustifolius]OIW17951.1 hypothetical protein TanjilG_17787 [Lupinus angustifolius]
MGSQEVKLLSFWVSPFSKRVEWALKLKGIDYEYIEEDVFNKSHLLLELNPITKKVPVLVHGQKTIAESFVIIEYIDETWNDQYPLLPQQPYQRAIARFLANLVEEHVMKPAFVAMCATGEEREKAMNVIREAMYRIEEEIKGKKFFGGENIGYLDIALGWISYFIPVWEEVGSLEIIDPFKYPATYAWMTNFITNPMIKDTLSQRDKMIDYFHNMKREYSST